MNTLVTMGAHTIRSQTLGVSVGNPLSLEPALNEFNDAAFGTIDWAVYQAREHGLRIFAPLVDNYDYYHGGKYDFLRFRGINISSTASPIDPQVMQFYTNRTIINDFKNYIHHLLTHVNPYTGLTYAEDPTIFAYETGNELGGTVFGDEDVPVEWTDEICRYVKSLGPHKLCIDGTYGVNRTHLNIASVDIFDDHFYPLNLTKLQDDIALVGSANKVYLAGEYDWTGNQASAPSLQSFYDIIEARQNLSNPVVAGDLFWSLFGRDVPNCEVFVNHTDGFTLQYNNPLNTAHNDTQISTIRRHFFRMQGIEVSSYLPDVPCTGKYEDLTYSPGVLDFEADVY
jgi:mannan endo-1,4-beta-mannosidase